MGRAVLWSSRHIPGLITINSTISSVEEAHALGLAALSRQWTHKAMGVDTPYVPFDTIEDLMYFL